MRIREKMICHDLQWPTPHRMTQIRQIFFGKFVNIRGERELSLIADKVYFLDSRKCACFPCAGIKHFVESQARVHICIVFFCEFM
jgi:hypothetical protein